MIIVMQEGATEEQVEAIIDRLVNLGFNVHRSTGVVHTVLGCVGPAEQYEPADFEVMDGVKEVHRITSPYKLASRAFRPSGTVIQAGEVAIGGNAVAVIAGPCSVESPQQMLAIAKEVARAGARFLRGGALQPSAPSYTAKGLGREGLTILRDAAAAHGLRTVAEVTEACDVPLAAEYADVMQIGARNMLSHALLREAGRQPKPVLLERGTASTFEELLIAAEHILTGGNYNVILCERGIRTFETYTRNTLDISAIPILHKLSHLPVMADPSHGTGRRDKVMPMARAAVAAGADGLIIEVHNDPERALADGALSLRPSQFAELMDQLRALAPAVGRTI